MNGETNGRIERRKLWYALPQSVTAQRRRQIAIIFATDLQRLFWSGNLR
ncbi:hypothetical protein Fuma_03362 [Fuerstiella marisgermanici]|uniref:Uncharacterized protein n=1 Tax=Fuerstiella marisgermanici TaxID=1891926 RepID=A0A1P8WI57_9PLAN|nr:hypothetical protein Fuma_03362 [Fuerstiella marisgermanici]